MNREVPHLLVLPEDRANSQLVNGFVLHASIDDRRIKVMKEAGGWREVLNQFENTFVRDLHQHPDAFLILLFDFDGRENRSEEAFGKIPEDLRNRVFVLGVFSEPEDLKKHLRNSSLERIGNSLASDCNNENGGNWNHQLLRHNSKELVRIRETVSKFLFRTR